MKAILFYTVYALVWLITWLPMPLLYGVSNFFFFLIYHVVGYRRQVVYDNLRKSFPEKTEAEILKIRKEFYRHFADIIIEIGALLHFSPADIQKRCKFNNLEVLENLHQQGKSVTAVLAHYGNWEWQTVLGLLTNFRAIAIYKPLSNKHFDNFMIRLRQKFGLEPVPMARVYRTLAHAQSNGEKTLTFFIGDQSPMRRDIKLWIEFLNQKTGVFLGADKISKKLNNAIVYFKMKKIRRGYYEVDVIPLFDDLSEVAENEITQKHMAILEDMIKDKPQDWLWSHRRWKHQPN